MSKRTDHYDKLFDSQNASNSKKEQQQKDVKKVEDNRKVLFNQKNSKSVDNFVRKLYKNQEKEPLIPKEDDKSTQVEMLLLLYDRNKIVLFFQNNDS